MGLLGTLLAFRLRSGPGTPGSRTSVDDFDCAPNRGPPMLLFMVEPLVERFHDAGVQRPAGQHRGRPGAAVSTCRDERGQIPNFVAVNWYDQGDLLQVVDQLNGFAVVGAAIKTGPVRRWWPSFDGRNPVIWGELPWIGYLQWGRIAGSGRLGGPRFDEGSRHKPWILTGRLWISWVVGAKAIKLVRVGRWRPSLMAGISHMGRIAGLASQRGRIAGRGVQWPRFDEARHKSAGS